MKTNPHFTDKSFWIKIVLYWLVLFLLMYVFGLFYNYFVSDRVPDWKKVLRNQFEFSLIWAILIPFIILFSSKFSLFSKRWPINLIIHLFAAFVFAIFIGLIQALIHYRCLWTDGLAGVIGKIDSKILYTFQTPFFVVIYGMTALAVNTFNYYNQMKIKMAEASQLQAQLVQAQLQALKMQLNPHFLFNTLHAISSLMGSDIKAARNMVARLSDLLRNVLDSNNVDLVSLNEELKILNLYLEIEQIRFQDRLKVIFDIEKDTLAGLIPHLLLQPIVENAIKHGIAPFSDSGKLKIFSKKIDERLIIEINDNGIGIDQDFSYTNGGIGLSNTEQRLRTIYKDQFKLIFENNTEGGLTVKIEIPFQTNSISQ